MFKNWKLKVLSVLSVIPATSAVAFAVDTYTPLLTSTSFDGPKADLLLAVNGSLLFVFIVLGLGLIMRVLLK